MWKTLDATKVEKYCQVYRNELIAYHQLLDQYKRTISEDDKRTVKQKRQEIHEEIEKRKIVRLQRKKAHVLNRPKKPTSVYLKYLEEQADRQPNEKYYDYLRRKSAEWKLLSDSEKDCYKPPAGDMQNYVWVFAVLFVTQLQLQAIFSCLQEQFAGMEGTNDQNGKLRCLTQWNSKLFKVWRCSETHQSQVDFASVDMDC